MYTFMWNKQKTLRSTHFQYCHSTSRLQTLLDLPTPKVFLYFACHVTWDSCSTFVRQQVKESRWTSKFPSTVAHFQKSCTLLSHWSAHIHCKVELQLCSHNASHVVAKLTCVPFTFRCLVQTQTSLLAILPGDCAQSQGFGHPLGSRYVSSKSLKSLHSDVIRFNSSILFLTPVFIWPCTVFYSVNNLKNCCMTQTGALHAFCLVIGISFCIWKLFAFQSLSTAWDT